MLATAAFGGLLVATAELVPAVMDKTEVLEPSAPYNVRVGVGEAKFLSFNCMGGPADVVITLSTYAEKADPLLFLSLNPVEPPTFQKHDSSNFGQWREDAAGDHYVIAKGVSPEGGILGLVNVRPFAREELRGILSIQCNYIIAFDALFWDHLRSKEVCPIGENLQAGDVFDPTRFCSGHGECVDHGVCECDGDHTGAACEHKQDDIVTAAEGRYRFSLDTGHYQYFRVRVPNEFPGGYLEVQTWGERPLVVLIKGDSLPTKSNFELSNFDDWVSQRNISVLKYKVPAVASFYSNPDSRRLHEELSFNLSTEAKRRHLQGAADCPDVGFRTHVPGCRTEMLRSCETDCEVCTSCVKGRDGPTCSSACLACTSSECKRSFTLCAGDLSCAGREAMYCKSDCGGCMACLDSNDRKCGTEQKQKCKCCLDCLPMASKCGRLDELQETHYIFVGVFNHRRYNNDMKTVHALADVVLKLDPKFEETDIPSSWLAELYDPFHDLTHFKSRDSQIYPEGDQYIYELDPVRGKEVREQVRVYHDRMTLLHIPNEHLHDRLMMSFVGTNITHVLVSTRAAPKTFFDFNAAPPVQPGRKVQITAGGEPALWCAIFGGSDGWAEVRAAKYEDPNAGAPSFLMSFLLFVVILLCVAAACLTGGGDSLKDLVDDESVPLSHKLWCFVTRQSIRHESQAELMREQSMSNFVSSDVVDQSVEDQFLMRGGMGDDGI